MARVLHRATATAAVHTAAFPFNTNAKSSLPFLSQVHWQVHWPDTEYVLLGILPGLFAGEDVDPARPWCSHASGISCFLNFTTSHILFCNGTQLVCGLICWVFQRTWVFGTWSDVHGWQETDSLHLVPKESRIRGGEIKLVSSFYTKHSVFFQITYHCLKC